MKMLARPGRCLSLLFKDAREVFTMYLGSPARRAVTALRVAVLAVFRGRLRFRPNRVYRSLRYCTATTCCASFPFFFTNKVSFPLEGDNRHIFQDTAPRKRAGSTLRWWPASSPSGSATGLNEDPTCVVLVLMHNT